MRIFEVHPPPENLKIEKTQTALGDTRDARLTRGRRRGILDDVVDLTSDQDKLYAQGCGAKDPGVAHITGGRTRSVRNPLQ